MADTLAHLAWQGPFPQEQLLGGARATMHWLSLRAAGGSRRLDAAAEIMVKHTTVVSKSDKDWK